MLWDQAAVAMGQAPSSNTGRELEEDERVDSAHPPTLANPIGGPMQLASSLWGSYGPSILAGGMALVGAARNAQAQSQSGSSSGRRPGASALTTPPSSRIRTHTRAAERKRRPESGEVPVSNIEGLPGGSGTSSRSSSDSIVHTVRRKDHVRSRSGSGGSGRFEEVEVPSDVEGYDIGDETQVAHNAAAGRAGGGWFSGWGSSPTDERVKRD